MTDPTPAHLGTLGPCPTCGRERLIRVEMQRLPGAGIGFEAVHWIDCGGCPTIRATLHPPTDEPTA